MGYELEDSDDDDDKDDEEDRDGKGDTDSTETVPVDNTKTGAADKQLWIETGPAIDTTCAPTAAALRKAKKRKEKEKS